jgi:3-hydroxybutyryl-CoA dehydrogenase
VAEQLIGVVGGGLMGAGIAAVCARSELDVILVERDAAASDRARARVERSLERAVGHGKLDRSGAEAAARRIRYGVDLHMLEDRELVIEAVAEDEALKVELFGQLDDIVANEDALLASNTSSIPIMTLAVATTRPSNVIGIHFFNPVPVMELVELIPTLTSSAKTTQRAEEFAVGTLDKVAVWSQDRAGFVVNALLIPYLLSAVRMLESGFATAEDIDNGMVLGCGHPMGPLRLIDLIGVDTTAAVANAMYAEFKEPLYSPSPLLRRMVDAGLLGKKAGRGFFEYPATD